MSLMRDLPSLQPGDIYEDKHGGKWAVVGFWTEPVVVMERAWPRTDGDAERQQAGVSGLLWDGFRRLAPSPAPRGEEQS